MPIGTRALNLTALPPSNRPRDRRWWSVQVGHAEEVPELPFASALSTWWSWRWQLEPSAVHQDGLQHSGSVSEARDWRPVPGRVRVDWWQPRAALQDPHPRQGGQVACGPAHMELRRLLDRSGARLRLGGDAEAVRDVQGPVPPDWRQHPRAVRLLPPGSGQPRRTRRGDPNQHARAGRGDLQQGEEQGAVVWHRAGVHALRARRRDAIRVAQGRLPRQAAGPLLLLGRHRERLRSPRVRGALQGLHVRRHQDLRHQRRGDAGAVGGSTKWGRASASSRATR